MSNAATLEPFLKQSDRNGAERANTAVSSLALHCAQISNFLKLHALRSSGSSSYKGTDASHSYTTLRSARSEMIAIKSSLAPKTAYYTELMR